LKPPRNLDSRRSRALVAGLDGNSRKKVERIRVNEFNQVVGYETFCSRRYASMESETYPQGHPMMAQPAMQQGELLGES
jgi:NADH dehydrogenase